MRFTQGNGEAIINIRAEAPSSAHPAGCVTFRWGGGITRCVVLRWRGATPFSEAEAAACPRTVLDKADSLGVYDLAADRRDLRPGEEITLCFFARAPMPAGEEETLIGQEDSFVIFREPATVWYCVSGAASERRGLFRRRSVARDRYLKIRLNVRARAEDVRYGFSQDGADAFTLPRATEADETITLGPLPPACETAYVFADAARFRVVRADAL